MQMANDSEFTVYLYENEYEYLKWLVLQKQFIETGGDLFGVWHNEVSAVVQFVLGPGKHCQRTVTAFYQDVSYLEDVGRYLTKQQGLCNIGEWHSHHRLGLARPSDGDQNTVWSHMPTISGGRFLLFIANIQGIGCWSWVDVGCFMFNNATGRMSEGKMKLLRNCSPLRHTFTEKPDLDLDAEQGQDWNAFCMFKIKRTERLQAKNKVEDAELGRTCCVCGIEEETCFACLLRIISCICRCLSLRCTFAAFCRCTCWAFRLCLSGLMNLPTRFGRQPARD